MSDVIYNISSGFFDSVNGDRLYSAGDMNKPYKRVIADGIFPTPQGTPSTDFQVVAVSGMSVAVLAGNAMIGARWAENTDDVGITIAGNSSSSPRIDSIFLHIDTGMDTRAAGVVYRQGTAAGTPTAPAMVQTDNITELRLADILVAPSAAIITQANITDQRGGSDCPWVAGLIQQVDTSALFDQYRAAYAEQQQEQTDEWKTFMDHLARDYDISMSLRKHESTYTSTAAASLIPINIDGYDTTKDLLQVYINGIFAVEGTHYIVKSDAQIQLTNAISAGQKVHFVIYKAVMGGAQPIIPTDEQVQDAVDAYMDAHPGALVVDPELSDTSTHAIQNKAVTEALAGVNGRLYGISDLNGIARNIFSLASSVKSETLNGITIEVIDSTTIKLNGTSEKAFNINVGYQSYSVAPNEVSNYMIKVSGEMTSGGIHGYAGWFNGSNVASNGARIGVVNEFVKVSYASDAAKSRDYINIHEGATFTDAVLTFINTYNLPINSRVLELTQKTEQALTTAEQSLRTNLVCYPNIDFEWEIGSISNTTGLDQNSGTRLRCRKILLGKDSVIKTDSNVGAYIFPYSESGEFDREAYTVLGNNAEYVLPKDEYVRFTLRKSDYSAFSDSDIETYAGYIAVERKTAQTFFESKYVTQAEFDAAQDGDTSIPSYFSDHLNTAIETARDNIINCGLDGDSFFFLSDLHWENNSHHSGALISKANRKLNVSKIICGGDVINGSGKESAIDNMSDAINSYKGVTRFYCLCGNHDTNEIGTTTADQLSKDNVYAIINKEADFNMIYGAPCYYYFDNPTTKTRYICLDTGTNGDLGQAQNAWLTNVLNNTTSGWHILIFAHIIYTASSWHVGLQPSDLFMTSYFQTLSTQFDTFNTNNSDKKIEAIFGGHTHIDANFVTSGGIPIVLIDTDSRGTYSTSGGAVGTTNEHCFDIVTINYNAKEIKCIRVGRGVNRSITY